MKTKLKEKINIVTLGCSKNLVDSEVLLTQLKGNNEEVYHQSNDINPDVVIINTCGFIDNAKQESIDTILRYAKEKEEGNIKIIINTAAVTHVDWCETNKKECYKIENFKDIKISCTEDILKLEYKALGFTNISQKLIFDGKVNNFKE